MKLLTSCVIALTLAPSLGLAQTYACQYIKSAGLKWSKGFWEPTEFKSDLPFFLQVKGGSLTADSAAKALRTELRDVVCNPPASGGGKDLAWTFHACSSTFGESLIFDHETQNGGISRIHGSAQATGDQRKDTLSVASFTCQKIQ